MVPGSPQPPNMSCLGIFQKTLVWRAQALWSDNLGQDHHIALDFGQLAYSCSALESIYTWAIAINKWDDICLLPDSVPNKQNGKPTLRSACGGEMYHLHLPLQKFRSAVSSSWWVYNLTAPRHWVWNITGAQLWTGSFSRPFPNSPSRKCLPRILKRPTQVLRW